MANTFGLARTRGEGRQVNIEYGMSDVADNLAGPVDNWEGQHRSSMNRSIDRIRNMET